MSIRYVVNKGHSISMNGTSVSDGQEIKKGLLSKIKIDRLKELVATGVLSYYDDEAEKEAKEKTEKAFKKAEKEAKEKEAKKAEKEAKEAEKKYKKEAKKEENDKS